MSQLAVHELVNQILDAAKKQGMDQQQLAERAGLSTGTVSRIKHQSDASYSSLSKLAAAVGLRLTLVADDDFVVNVELGRLF
jgi:transcriptional regulator with XRE-family HTH domain